MSKKKKILKKVARPKLKLKKVTPRLKPETVTAPAPVIKEKGAEHLSPPRGMRDILPADEVYWNYIYDKSVALARSFGYGMIETPILEQKALFLRGVGQTTDIVQKEMYAFVDQGGEELAVRPEATASVARAYINHGMVNLPQPIKVWYFGPFLRRERPQAGRSRQFHQWGLESLGEEHPILDAEIISVAYHLFSDLGISVVVQINSIGCTTCRQQFKTELVKFYRSKFELLCDSCKERFQRNPLRLLDCKESQCELLKEGAPQITDALDDACRDHFMKVLEYLDDVGIPYALNPYLVRGLDYYNRTVFEFVMEDREQKTENGAETKKTEHEEAVEEGPSSVPRPPSLGAQSALGGGGRYDGLVELLGGRPTPACGFSIGIERTIAALKELAVPLPPLFVPKVFIAQLGENARRKAFILWHAIRREIPVAASLAKDGLKAQLEAANHLGVRYAVIIGQKEIVDGTAIIRDMEAGIQEIVDYNKVISELRKKLTNQGT
ncbi:MAG: Histidine-tRNA ligase [Candidatus Magasanikbacteria bacterium GW2011_GWA2_50_22]|uniref:Histidine--tRNA ligase n=1 Tax=Candidatus Magasanikbacteria bacterium GW2011_GWA2_50_22 TaxID=1619043 RepID=A0A0G1WF37_9BACT|nr:MAG: Histidine-tRNA ligase [Candidatus Magasanikbacteria bacterium GW2011_GWA2_50_22]